MPDLKDGESVEIQGSARLPYILKNVGGVYSCTCPAWRNQSLGIERRTCKHLRATAAKRPNSNALAKPCQRRPVRPQPNPSRPCRSYCWPKPGRRTPTLPASG